MQRNTKTEPLCWLWGKGGGVEPNKMAAEKIARASYNIYIPSTAFPPSPFITTACTSKLSWGRMIVSEAYSNSIFDPALLDFGGRYSQKWSYCRPLTLKVRWISFADFCTDWRFPYFLLLSLTDFFHLQHTDFTKNIYRILIKQTGHGMFYSPLFRSLCFFGSSQNPSILIQTF